MFAKCLLVKSKSLGDQSFIGVNTGGYLQNHKKNNVKQGFKLAL